MPTTASLVDTAEIETSGNDVTTDAESSADVTCTQCESTTPWGHSSWCPDCGYHPKLKRCIDVGPKEEVVAEQPATLLELFPLWSWVLAAGILGLFGLSIATHLQLDAGDPFRGTISCWMLIVSGGAVLASHLTGYIRALFGGMGEVKPWDVIMNPLAVWMSIFKRLPGTTWQVWAGSWGLTGILCAMGIIGGIRYSVVFDDWGVKPAPKANLVHAIVDQACQERPAESQAASLEDAVNEFTGEEDGAAGGGLKGQESKEESAANRTSIDCLIVGYTTRFDKTPDSLLLASLVDNKLRFVGRILWDDIPQATQKHLLKRMPELPRSRPFVKTPFSAEWLEPVLTCEIETTDWNSQRKLREERFVKLLSELN